MDAKRGTICVATTLCFSFPLAPAASSAVRGHERDPSGDATVSLFQGPPAADIKRVSVTYNAAAGRFVLEARLFSPAPRVYALKGMFASRRCPPAGADVLDYDLGGSAILRVNGTIPSSVTRRSARHGNRLIESWSGPELRRLGLGCVRGSVSTGGIGGFGLDEFGPFALG
jgi:hypothetical protein